MSQQDNLLLLFSSWGWQEVFEAGRSLTLLRHPLTFTRSWAILLRDCRLFWAHTHTLSTYIHTHVFCLLIQHIHDSYLTFGVSGEYTKTQHIYIQSYKRASCSNTVNVFGPHDVDDHSCHNINVKKCPINLIMSSHFFSISWMLVSQKRKKTKELYAEDIAHKKCIFI